MIVVVLFATIAWFVLLRVVLLLCYLCVFLFVDVCFVFVFFFCVCSLCSCVCLFYFVLCVLLRFIRLCLVSD